MGKKSKDPKPFVSFCLRPFKKLRSLCCWHRRENSWLLRGRSVDKRVMHFGARLFGEIGTMKIQSKRRFEKYGYNWSYGLAVSLVSGLAF